MMKSLPVAFDVQSRPLWRSRLLSVLEDTRGLVGGSQRLGRGHDGESVTKCRFLGEQLDLAQEDGLRSDWRAAKQAGPYFKPFRFRKAARVDAIGTEAAMVAAPKYTFRRVENVLRTRAGS